MLDILKQDERHVLSAVSAPPSLDDAIPDIAFKLLLPAISLDFITLGRTKDKTNTSGFLRYLDLLRINLEETNHIEVVEIFGMMHPWTEVLKDVNDFGKPGLHVRKKKKDKIQTYIDIIQPPVFQVEESVRKITLWAVNILSGDLECCIISEDSQGAKQIESKVLEKQMTVTL